MRYAAVRGTEPGNDAVRLGDAPATPAQIEAYVQSRVVITPIRVFTTWTPGGGGLPLKSPGLVTEVRVEYDFDPITPLVPIFPETLSSTAQNIIYY